MIWMRKNWGRMLLGVAGLMLLMTALLNPLIQEKYMEHNSQQENMPALEAGDVLEQQITAEAPIKQISLRAGVVKDAKELALKGTLSSDGMKVVQMEFPLKSVRTKGRLIYDLPEVLPAGNYVLRIEAEGAGSVKLCGGMETAAVVNEKAWDTGCYVRMVCYVKEYSKAAIFCGVLLMLVALTPGGGKEKNCVKI